jgi:hypothetical protein
MLVESKIVADLLTEPMEKNHQHHDLESPILDVVD